MSGFGDLEHGQEQEGELGEESRGVRLARWPRCYWEGTGDTEGKAVSCCASSFTLERLLWGQQEGCVS